MSKHFTIFKNHALRLFLSISILLFFIFHALNIVEWEFIKALENEIYDTRLELSMPNSLDDKIVILDIDEKSLSEIGRWPWNRSVIARLIDQLFDVYHIDVLGMDVVFVEADDSSGLKQLQLLAQGVLKDAPAFLETVKDLEKTLDYDKQLEQSLQNRRIVLGYAFTKEDTKAGKLPQPLFTKPQTSDFTYFKGNGFAANLAQFQESTNRAGHFGAFPDSDGIMRRTPLLYGYQEQLYESLALAVTRMALGSPEIKFGIKHQFLQVGPHKVPVSQDLQALIPFRGKSQQFFSYISASDVLYGRVKEDLTDKIVLLGTSAEGLRDSRATPVEEDYPGIEIHANIISGILNDNILENPKYIHNIETIILILIGLVMIIGLPLLNPLLATLGMINILGIVFLLNLCIWTQMQVILPLATIFLLILTLFLFNMSYGYIVESRNKRHLTHLFGQYIPPELVKEMSQNLGNSFSMEGESREMTVFFSDIRGFTSISEGFDPKELSELMNEYLTPMTHVIHENRGTIDKYMGDAIMAFWGAPLPDSRHAFHALEAAMEMLKRLESMQLEFKVKGWPKIRIGIGLNTGIMNIGNMGSQFRIAYTVLGDTVNLGSRLEGATKQYGIQIIVSETTKSAVPEYFYRELDRVKVKGKEQPVAIFEPIGRHDEVDKHIVTEVDDYDIALGNYRQQLWNVAKNQFVKLSEKNPKCMLYRLYLERIEHFIVNNPGKEWDGVYTFTSK